MTLSKNLALGTVSYHPYTLDDAIAGANRAGYDCLEIAAGMGAGHHLSTTMGDAAVDEVRRKLDRHGLEVTGINGNIGLMTDERAGHTKRALSLAAKLGARILCNTIAGPGSHEETSTSS